MQTETYAAIGLAVALVKIIDLLVNFIISKLTKTDIDEILDNTRKNLTCTNTLYAMHNVTDADGSYMWYVPRSWADKQTVIEKHIFEITHSQEEIAKVLNRLVDHLDITREREVILLETSKQILSKLEKMNG